MSRAIQSGAMRPQENGMAATGGGVPSRNYADFSRQDWKSLRDRARRGEKIQIV